MASTWGNNTWGSNEWGDDNITVTLSGQSTTSSVGSLEAFNEEGWGRQEWGNSGWGVEYAVQLSGQSATTSIGSITTEIAVPLTGLSTTSSLGTPTLDLTSIVIPTGQQAQTQLGDFDNAGTLVGWGRNGWGEEPYGDSFNKLVQLSGLTALSSSVGSLTVVPEELIDITGVSATSSVGSLTNIIDCVVVPTGVSATSSVGEISPTEMSIGLTGQSATATVGGIILDAIEIGLGGVEATSSVGSITPADSVGLTGQAATSTVGSLTLEIGIPLTGVSAAAATGTIIPEDVVGLTGVEAISSVGNIAALSYQDIDIDGNTSYSNVNKTNSASYSDVDVSGNTSYTDVTHVAQEKKIMASTYTPLGVELMATGENAGTWGTKTNTNLSLFEQITGGYKVQTLNAAGSGANTTALAVSDGSTGATLATRVIVLGAESAQAITGNKVVTIPLDVENTYFVLNNTSGAYTVQFKYVSGSGDTVTWATTDKGWKILSASANDGTNPDVKEVVLGGLPGGSDTQVQFNSSGSFAGDADLIWTAGTALTINSQKELRLADSDDSAYIGQKSAATVSGSYTLTWPAAVAGGNGYVLKSTTGGVLSWEELEAGGTSWQAVKTGNYTASAGEGVFCNTTSGSFTLTLPSSPTIGDEVSFIDYAGTFDTNALTIGRNSSKINGAEADLTVSVERAANTLVFTDSTQGWLLKSK